MTTRGSGRIFQPKLSSYFWCAFYFGKEIREVCRNRRTGEKLLAVEENRAEAEKYLQARREQVIGEKHGGAAFVAPSMARVTVNELLDDMVAEYCRGGRRGVERKVSSPMASQLRTLRKLLGTRRASVITSQYLEEFKTARKAEGKQPATVNRLLSLLAHAFKIAATATPRKVAYELKVQLLPEDNVRRGKFTPQEAAAIADALPLYMADVARFAYETGARRGEIVKLCWDYVDGDGIRVPAKDTKGRTDRTIAMTPELEAIIARRLAARIAGCELIFHRKGKPVGNYYRGWMTACISLGLGKVDANGKYSGAIFHDFRRSAAHEMFKSGSTAEECMRVTGHRTQHMFSRYADLFSEEEKRARQRAVQQRRSEWKAEQLAAHPVSGAVN